MAWKIGYFLLHIHSALWYLKNILTKFYYDGIGIYNALHSLLQPSYLKIFETWSLNILLQVAATKEGRIARWQLQIDVLKKKKY